MKHWDGRDRDDAVLLRLPQRDRARLAQFFEAPSPPRRREPARIGSVIGLALALGMLAGLAWVLAPGSPVSSSLLH
jgi:ferric-dicitrate binding protein FerR (iron transport regulator)